MERLQKVLARAGVASRRAAERLILEGRVRVNGEIILTLGTRVDPSRDSVRVDGQRVGLRPGRPTYLVLNKPRGYMTTLSDPEGRPTVLDLLQGVSARVFPIGRLDYQTEGLLLLTDDGDLAQALSHPARGVEKVYLAKVRGRPAPEKLEALRRGVRIDGRRAVASRASMSRPGANSWVQIAVVEGRKHLIRKMLERVGHPVSRLRRIGYGGVSLGSLPAGRFRPLTPDEVTRLRAVGRPAAPRGRGASESL